MQRTDPSDCCCIKYQYGRGHKCIKTDKNKTGLDVNDTEDNFKLNFIMIAKRVLEKEKEDVDIK